MSRVRGLLGATSRVLSWVSGVMVIAIMLVLVANVAMRELATSSVQGSVELSEVMLAFVVFAGLAYAQQSGSHVRTELVTSRLPDRVARPVRAVGLLVAAAVIAWCAVATAGRGIEAWQAGEARFGVRSVPTWPGRLAVPVGLGLLALEVLLSAVTVWLGPAGPAGPSGPAGQGERADAGGEG